MRLRLPERTADWGVRSLNRSWSMRPQPKLCDGAADHCNGCRLGSARMLLGLDRLLGPSNEFGACRAT